MATVPKELPLLANSTYQGKEECAYLGETVWHESYLTGDIYNNVHPNALVKRVGHLIGGYKEKSANQLKYTPSGENPSCLRYIDELSTERNCPIHI